MNEETLKPLVEAILLAADQPMSIDAIRHLVESLDNPVSRSDLSRVLDALAADCETRGVELARVASGYRYQVKRDYAPIVMKLWEEKPKKYSRALLETLALIAYRQPVTRAEIEDVRGVSVSSSIIKTLLDRQWVQVIGHRDTPGKPALYATTRQFLDYFGLRSLDELPSLKELQDLDAINPVLDLGEQGVDSEPRGSTGGESGVVTH
ncbi:MAG TPA: SMC-Scp complex subunit ScpB [Gammaproteobacteria bacterium]|nr:SMC-Scp complex subunit ScpB [Gammaproteobacteria bacterium]